MPPKRNLPDVVPKETGASEYPPATETRKTPPIDLGLPDTNKKGLPDVTELKELYGQFRSLVRDISGDDEDYLPEQLMILDDELYMKFAWLIRGFSSAFCCGCMEPGP